MWKFLAVIGVSVLTSFPQARTVDLSGGEGTPQRAVLSQAEMADIVGGVGTASINISFPEDFAKSDLADHRVEWNQAGNRCQYSCANGPSNVGFQADAFIFSLGNTSAPVLELYADGKGRAKTTATFLAAAGGYNAYSAAISTRCVGGTRNGQFCTSDKFCSDAGGRCAACDHTNNCSDRPALGPCQNICEGGPTPGIMCNLSSECGVGGTCVQPWVGAADTCYLLARCANSEDTQADCWQDCSNNGVDANADSGDVTKPGPFHSATVRVNVVPSGGGPFEIAREENVYKIEKANASQTDCSGPHE